MEKTVSKNIHTKICISELRLHRIYVLKYLDYSPFEILHTVSFILKNVVILKILICYIYLVITNFCIRC